MVQIVINMVDKLTVVKYTFEGSKFEILVKPDPALDYKLGKTKEIAPILVSDEIYSDSSQGTRASSEKLQKVFKTEDALAIAEKILQKGDLNLTTDQRRKMTTEKRKQVIVFIAKTFVDPRSHLPHPPLRIEQALTDARVSIDPFKSVEEQVKECGTILFCLKINWCFEKRRLANKWILESDTRNTGSSKTKRDR